MRKKLRCASDNGDGSHSISLPDGFAIVDSADVGLVSAWHWHAHAGWVRGRVEGHKLLLHRYLAGATDAERVSHVDGDTRNNRRANLLVRPKEEARRPITDNGDGTSTVPLTRGAYAVVDTASVPVISSYLWSCNSHGYACARVGRARLLMHRLLTVAPSGVEVDHANADRADNRLANLRLCDRTQNQQNRRLNTSSKSGYKGVSWHKGRGRWAARIMASGRAVSLGYFDDASDAARAYDDACVRLFGAFARPNATTAKH